ncbi:MAG TPA: hypothetical protein IGR64_04495 [Leptolyngbyaceae cyanobacterium M65_K2018_010]|nr:hypothetical protein [Leptolyngbyaceae cyanobacterium M65_K2018_010]
MKVVLQALGLGSLGLGSLAIATGAAAEPPAVYYSWRAMETSVTQCVNQARQALATEALIPVQADENSVAGQSDDATAVFICLESPGASTVLVIVSSQDETNALALREALKAAF